MSEKLTPEQLNNPAELTDEQIVDALVRTDATYSSSITAVNLPIGRFYYNDASSRLRTIRMGGPGAC